MSEEGPNQPAALLSPSQESSFKVMDFNGGAEQTIHHDDTVPNSASFPEEIHQNNTAEATINEELIPSTHNTTIPSVDDEAELHATIHSEENEENSTTPETESIHHQQDESLEPSINIQEQQQTPTTTEEESQQTQETTPTLLHNHEQEEHQLLKQEPQTGNTEPSQTITGVSEEQTNIVEETFKNNDQENTIITATASIKNDDDNSNVHQEIISHVHDQNNLFNSNDTLSPSEIQHGTATNPQQDFQTDTPSYLESQHNTSSKNDKFETSFVSALESKSDHSNQETAQENFEADFEDSDFDKSVTTQPPTAQQQEEPIKNQFEAEFDDSFGNSSTQQGEFSQNQSSNPQDFNDNFEASFDSSSSSEPTNQPKSSKIDEFDANFDVDPVAENSQANEFENSSFDSAPNTTTTNSLTSSEENNQNQSTNDEDFGDFNEPIVTEKTNDEDDFGDFKEPENTEPQQSGDDDGFGDFEEPKEEQTQSSESQQVTTTTLDSTKTVEDSFEIDVNTQKYVIDSILSLNKKTTEEATKLKTSIHNMLNGLVPPELRVPTYSNDNDTSSFSSENLSNNTLEKLFNMNSNHNADILSKMAVWQNSCIEKHFLLALGLEKKKNKKQHKPLRKVVHRRTASHTVSSPITSETIQQGETSETVDQRMKIDDIGTISQRMIGGARHRRMNSTVTDLHLSPRLPLNTQSPRSVSPVPCSSSMSPTTTTNQQHFDELISSYTPTKTKSAELDDIAALVFGSDFTSPKPQSNTVAAKKETSSSITPTPIKNKTSTVPNVQPPVTITTTSASPVLEKMSTPVKPTSFSSSQQSSKCFEDDRWGNDNDSWDNAPSTRPSSITTLSSSSVAIQSATTVPKQESPIFQKSTQETSEKFEAKFDDDDFGSSGSVSNDLPAVATTNSSLSVTTSQTGGLVQNKFEDDGFGDFPTSNKEEDAFAPQQKISTVVTTKSTNSTSDDDGFGDFPEPKDTVPNFADDGWGNDNSGWSSSDAFIPSTTTSASSTQHISVPPSSSPQTTTIQAVASQSRSLKNEEAHSFDDDFGEFPEPKDDEKPTAPQQQDSEVFSTPPKESSFGNSSPLFQPSSINAVQKPSQDTFSGASNDDFGEFPQPKDETRHTTTATDDDFGEFPEPKEEPVPQFASDNSWSDNTFTSAPISQASANSIDQFLQLSSQQSTSSPVASFVETSTTINTTSSTVPSSNFNDDPFDFKPSVKTVEAPPTTSAQQAATSPTWPQSAGSPSTFSTNADSWMMPSTSQSVSTQSPIFAAQNPKINESSSWMDTGASSSLNNAIFGNDDDFGDFPEPKDEETVHSSAHTNIVSQSNMSLDFTQNNNTVSSFPTIITSQKPTSTFSNNSPTPLGFSSVTNMSDFPKRNTPTFTPTKPAINNDLFDFGSQAPLTMNPLSMMTSTTGTLQGVNNNTKTDDEFGDFPEAKEYPTTHKDNNNDDDGFGDFQEPLDEQQQQQNNNNTFGMAWGGSNKLPTNIPSQPSLNSPQAAFNDLDSWLSTGTTGGNPASNNNNTDDWMFSHTSNSTSSTTTQQQPASSTNKDLFEFF
ncbi:hypothetical protein FDP41_011287 [Naegleria fowleri]|uniref:Uncharacterized protein n=1 Tax=Naegleria fowleri TaxID=5763 RepID=A0A6A5BYI6_NAEFO|nr:uncharacterized protein FDP41_011287 [Naegleria fowleri]KAF0982357.1 hypothetical protein FDP41_011287 [Naegleria fowleri]